MHNNTLPLATLLVVTFNHEQFIADAFKGAIAQDYSNLEIVFSDDCSTDRTLELLRDLCAQYRGPHKLKLLSAERNRGIAEHLNEALRLTSGELVVMAAGDDVSSSSRVSRYMERYIASKTSFVAIYSAVIQIDESSKVVDRQRWSVASSSDALVMAKLSSGIYGCSSAYSRDMFERFEPLSSKVIREDLVFPFRAAICGRIDFIDEPLVQYRTHSNNLWARRKVNFTKHEYLIRRKTFAIGDQIAISARIADLTSAIAQGICNVEQPELVLRALDRQLMRKSLEVEILNDCRKMKFLALLPKLMFVFALGTIARFVYILFLPETNLLNKRILIQ